MINTLTRGIIEDMLALTLPYMAGLGMLCSTVCAAETNLQQIATDIINKDYIRGHGLVSQNVQCSATNVQNGMIISIRIPETNLVARYWVMPELHKSWRCVNVLGISGPQYGAWAYQWSRGLTDEECVAVSRIVSPLEAPVTNDIIKNMITGKVIPECNEQWERGKITVRACKATVYTFQFHTKVSKGGSLRSVTLYIEPDGNIITRSEAMLFVD